MIIYKQLQFVVMPRAKLLKKQKKIPKARTHINGFQFRLPVMLYWCPAKKAYGVGLWNGNNRT
jgi:hypothetical protein